MHCLETIPLVNLTLPRSQPLKARDPKPHAVVTDLRRSRSSPNPRLHSILRSHARCPKPHAMEFIRPLTCWNSGRRITFLPDPALPTAFLFCPWRSPPSRMLYAGSLQFPSSRMRPPPVPGLPACSLPFSFSEGLWPGKPQFAGPSSPGASPCAGFVFCAGKGPENATLFCKASEAGAIPDEGLRKATSPFLACRSCAFAKIFIKSLKF